MSKIKIVTGVLIEEKQKMEKAHLSTLLLNFKVQTTKKQLVKKSLIAMVL
ncbi:MAG: hypothetical protein KAR12_10325 [Methylococcales bacterium]|nr:hypothetical protein [Methylococcales bacterium]